MAYTSCVGAVDLSQMLVCPTGRVLSPQHTFHRHLATNSTDVAEESSPQLENEKSEYHTIIKDSERGTGE